jgi:hypothetical protein
MEGFEAVVDAVRDEGMSLRQQLVEQAPEQESPAVRDAKDAENAGRQEKQIDLLGQIAKNVTDTGKNIDASASDEDSGFGGFIKKFLTLKKLLIGGAIALAVPVIMGFLDSDLWKKLKTTIKEKVLPALQSVYKTFKEDIIPALTKAFKFLKEEIYPVIEKTFLKQIKIVQGVIKDITAAFNKMADGDFLCGMYDLIVGLGSYILKSVDNISTGLYNIIAKIFGLEETDSVFGSISKFFKDTYKSVVDSIASTWKSVKDTITTTYNNVKNTVICFFTDIVDKVKNAFDFKEIIDRIMNLNLVKYVKSVFGDLFESICGIFAGDFSMKNLLKGGKALLDLVQTPLNLAINAIKDIFKFGDPNEPFRLSKFITDVAQSVVCWFGDNFSWETIKSKIDLGFDIVKSIKDKVSCIITGVKDYVFQFVNNVIKGIGEFFQKIVDFDVVATIRKIASGAGELAQKAIKFLFGEEGPEPVNTRSLVGRSRTDVGQMDDTGGPEENKPKLPQNLSTAVKIGAYDKSFNPFADSDINKKILEKGVESGQIQKEMLQAIINDSDLSDKDLKFMEILVKKATTKGSLFVHDIKAIEKMDEVVKKINEASLSKAGGAAAPVVVNNVTNAPVDASSSSVTNAATMPISPPTNYVAIL